MADVPGVPPAEELSALPAAELAARLAEAYRVIGELTARAEQLAVVNERLTVRVEELERQVRRDSATSSRPPSSDSPYKKKGRDRSLRERGKRRPGKQPGDPGTTMKLIDDPDARFWRYVHLACTAYLTHMHTGDRSADAIDAGGVLPGYRGVIVRDGYFAYGHLTDALHAWCGAHLLRDLKDLYDFEPGRQDWASQMAALLIEARGAARDARQAGKTALDAGVLEDLVTRYRALATSGLAANTHRRTATAKDARGIARRFLSFEDMILRFATRPDLDIFTNNEAERTIRPVKVQQRSSGGAWRTIEGLADFAIIQSCLSTATKWGVSKLDALRDLFNGHAWIPPGLEPSG